MNLYCGIISRSMVYFCRRPFSGLVKLDGGRTKPIGNLLTYPDRPQIKCDRLFQSECDGGSGGGKRSTADRYKLVMMRNRLRGLALGSHYHMLQAGKGVQNVMHSLPCGGAGIGVDQKFGSQTNVGHG